MLYDTDQMDAVARLQAVKFLLAQILEHDTFSPAPTAALEIVKDILNAWFVED